MKVYCDDKSIIRNEEWGWLGQIKTTSIFKYLFLPYGPFSSNKESNDAIFKSIVETAKKNKLDFIKFEPRGDISNEFITSLGAKKVKNYNPKDTLVIDLTQSIDDIKSAMSSSTKNMINKSQKRGSRVLRSNDINLFPKFIKLMHKTAQHAGINNHPDNYYKTIVDVLFKNKTAEFYFVEADGTEPFVGGIIYTDKSTKYYAHIGSDYAVNKLYGGSTLMVWQMIDDAKKEGLKYFDFCGVSAVDADKSDKLYGVSIFKRSFGGETVSNIGTYVLPINKFKYSLYDKLKKIV